MHRAAFVFLAAASIGAGLFAHGISENSLVYEKFFEAPRSSAVILFGGDMMFDRSVRQVAEEKGGDFLFSCIDDVLQGADLVLANLEGPITTYPSKSVGSVIGSSENFTFTFSTSTATLLARHNIRMVNLGNNHIMNFGRDGLLQTLHYLDAAGVRHFGDPDKNEDGRVARIEIGGIPLSLVNWSDWTSDKTDHTMAQIHKEVLSGRTVIVYTHWGEEYVPPTDYMRRLARAFVDAGASIVIGSHPHVVQEHEVYGGTHIYYSLGNFIFDQYWNDEVSTGLLLRVTFSKEGVENIEEIPIRLGRDRRTCPIE